MKKLLTVLCILIFFTVQFQSVNAAETVSFKVDFAECRKDRLVDVAVNAYSTHTLSAATFSFSFNKNVLEFRKASVSGGAQLEYHETDDEIKLCYLNARGAEISSFAPIFTLTFYALAEGESDIHFQVDGCTDSSAQFLDAGSCTAGKVTVTGAAAQNSKTAEGSTVQTPDAGSSDKAASGKSIKATNGSYERTTAAVNDMGTVNNVISRDSDKLTPLIVLAVSLVIAIAFTGYLIFRKLSPRKNEKQNDKD